MSQSKYNSTKNLKITYYLGAGASFQALPVWEGQASSMIEVAEEILKKVENIRKSYSVPGKNLKHDFLYQFFKRLSFFGLKALEFGSIDIYAKRLFLLGDKKQLNQLKSCVSVYFDLWESGLLECSKKETEYLKLDKRYFSLLSVLLTHTEIGIKFSNQVSFVSWNYDLQLENAFESFMSDRFTSISSLVSYLNKERPTVTHLNGYRGVFCESGSDQDIIKKNTYSSIDQYLNKLFEREDQISKQDDCFIGKIKYGWELKPEEKIQVKKLMRETNILIIIGYSFPAFNRQIDQELIADFEEGSKYKRVIYQDPNANEDTVKFLFHSSTDVHLEKKNINQFYIPHEFLAPSEGEFFVV